MKCSYCDGQGYVVEVEQRLGDPFVEKTMIVCIPCGGTGMPAHAQMTMHAVQKEQERERKIKLREQWAQRSERWDRIHETARKVFPKPPSVHPVASNIDLVIAKR